MAKRTRNYNKQSGSARKRRKTNPRGLGSVYLQQYMNRRGVANKETGFVDLGTASYNFDTTGTITLLATVAQGASVNERIGKKLMWKSIQCRGFADSNSTATHNDCSVIIVYDKRPTGSLPAITDVLVSASSKSFNNDSNSGRFRILKRNDFTLNGNPTTPTSNQAVNADFYLDMRGLPAEFQAAGTGAIGDISLGAIYMITVGNAAAGTGAARLSGDFRTRFIDM